MDPFNDARAEFWGDLQKDFYTETSVLFLANQTLETVLSTDGRKAHKPILSQPTIRNYTPHQDITFDRKKAEKQTLEVDKYPSAAEVIDITEKNQTPYDLLGHSSKGIRKGLINRTEQLFISNIKDASHVINQGVVTELSTSNVLPIIQQADGILGAFDAPTETSMRAWVVGPQTLALLRRVKSERETGLGDSVLSDGRVGPWQGWTVVSNNNLPWAGTLTIATQPTNLDKVIIMGRVFEFRTNLASGTAGTIGVLIGGSTAAARTNLKSAVEGTAGEGTTYDALDNVSKFIITNKRFIRVEIVSNDMNFTGFGDIMVSSDLTAGADGWHDCYQDMVFMIRGAIDLVMQFMELEIGSKEKGFADLPKGIIGVGSKMFQDGALMSVRCRISTDSWNEAVPA